MATHFGVLCKDEKIEESLRGQIRMHVQIIDCTATVTLSATYRLEHDGNGSHVGCVSFYFPRVINDQRHVIHGLKATLTTVDGNSEVALVYMDKSKVDDAKKDAETNGNVTTLVEDPDSDSHVFKCPLGKISDSTDVAVTFNYSCELPPEGQDTVRLWMPDLSLSGKPATGKLDFTAQIRSGYTVDKVESGIAQFQVWTFDNGVTDVGLVNADAVGSDIDMAITYKNMDALPALSIEKPDENATGLGWNSKTLAMLTVTPDLSDATQSMGGALGEYIFVVDRSGSMSGEKIDHAKETLLLFLKSLPVGCYFNIIGFGSRHQTLFNSGSVQYNGDTLEKAMKHQKSITANLGGTNLWSPLEEIFTKLPVVKGYPRHIFVLTDGAIFDTDRTINLVKNNAKAARLHAFGIGANADKALVRRLAEAGRGIHDFVEAFDRTMESKVMDALREAMTACATNLSVEWKLPKGISAVPISREMMKRPLAEGEHRIIYFEITGDLDGKHSKSSVTVTYDVDGVKKTFNIPLSLDNSAARVIKLVHRCAAVQKIKELQMCVGQGAEIIALSQEMNIESDDVTVTCRQVTTDYLATCIQEMTPAPAPVAAPTFGFAAAAPTPFGFGARKGRQGRRQRILRDNMYSVLPKCAVKRIMHRGGVARMSGLVPEEIRACLKEFLKKIVKDSILYAENGRRKTVNCEDVDAALKNNGIKMYGTEERCIYPFEDEPVAGKKRVIYRSTPFGRPDATTSTVASVLGVTAPLARPVLAKQRTKDISEVSSNLARVATTSSTTSLRKRKSGASPDGATARKQLSLRRSTRSSSSACPSPSRQPSLTKRVSLQRTVSSASSVSAAVGNVITPAMARQDSSVSTTSSQPISMTVTKTPSLRHKGSKTSIRKSTSTASTSAATVSSADSKRETRKRKSTADGPPKSKLMKRDTKCPPVVKTPKTPKEKKSSTIRQKAISRTRSRRSSIAGPSGGTSSNKPDFTDMINLITLQTFDGSWDLSKNFAAILRKSVDDLTNSVPEPRLHLKVWATVLGLSWLDKHFAHARTEFEMIQFKGMKWINSQDLCGLKVEQLMKNATKQL